MSDTSTIERPSAGTVEQRTALDVPAPTVDGRRLHGLIPYRTPSRDLGGWTEVIEPGALAGADLSSLIATREHDRSKLLGRHPSTLTTEDRSDGFAWSVELPQSPLGEDVRVAIERGDLRSTSWRMVVGRDRWEGDVRHVEQIAALHDVCVTAEPAYDGARAEYRSTPEPETSENRSTNPNGQEASMPADAPTTPADSATIAVTGPTVPAPEATPPENPAPRQEQRSAPAGGLRVEDRAASPRARSLTEAFRREGWPQERAELSFGEFRSVSLAAGDTAAELAPSSQVGVALGADERYAYPAFPGVGVESGTTSVNVVRQSARTLAEAADVIRAIDAVTEKPETASVVAITPTALKQVASKQSGIPNVYLETEAVATIVENDLRLAVNDGLDKLVLDALATADNVDPTGSTTLATIRAAITAIQAAGYSPDTLILDPATAEALDTLVAETGSEFYVFGPGQEAGSIFGLSKRVSTGAPAPVVCDAAAVGRLYTSPVSLQRFEENDGATNTSLVRLELHALFGVERIAAAQRIAAA